MKKAFGSGDMLNIIVVIALVVVVALPFLVGLISKNIMKERFKKSYGTVNAAITMSERDNETRSDCFYNPEGMPEKLSCVEYDENHLCTKWIDQYGEPYDLNSRVSQVDCDSLSASLEVMMRISQKCKNGYKEGCIPKYKGLETVYPYSKRNEFINKNENKLTNGCSKWRDSEILNSASWVLNDGSILLFYGDKPNFSLFALDINGKMGPNKWGHDLFPMYLKSVDSSPLEITEGVCQINEKGGISFKEMLK